MSAKTIRRVAVVETNRIAFSKAFTLYADQDNKNLLTAALQGLSTKARLNDKPIDEVVGGAVVNHPSDFNLVREAMLDTDISPYTCAYNVQQACGTSLQAALIVAAKIAAGHIDSGIACGVDSISKMPFATHSKLSDRLLKLNRARTFRQKRRCFSGFSLRELMPQPIRVNEQKTLLSMGQHCELMAAQWGIDRAAQDTFTLSSHQKAERAYANGFHKDLISPYLGVYTDNIMRPHLQIGDLQKLRPAFDKKNGTITAGNATALTDGASAVLLCSEDWAKQHGFDIHCFVTFGASGALDFVAGEGLLMAPTVAIDRVLKPSKLKFQDFDFYELHEAFAAQTLCVLKAMNDAKFNKKYFNRSAKNVHGTIDMDKINVMGSSLAYGHPFAATGGRILGVCEKLLRETPDYKRGLIAICTAGGMGVSAIVESP